MYTNNGNTGENILEEYDWDCREDTGVPAQGEAAWKVDFGLTEWGGGIF